MSLEIPLQATPLNVPSTTDDKLKITTPEVFLAPSIRHWKGSCTTVTQFCWAIYTDINLHNLCEIPLKKNTSNLLQHCSKEINWFINSDTITFSLKPQWTRIMRLRNCRLLTYIGYSTLTSGQFWFWACGPFDQKLGSNSLKGKYEGTQLTMSILPLK